MAAAALLLLAGAGCQRNLQAEWQLELRMRSLQHTVDTFVVSESSRPGRLERGVELIDRRLQRDARRTTDNVSKLEAWMRRDVERFEQRLPVYEREAGKRIWGKPERIERNASILLL